MTASVSPVCRWLVGAKRVGGGSRLLAKGGRTLTEDKMRRVMQRVADRASKADVKVMALLIREKLSASHGAHHWRAGQKISTELEVLPAELAAATHELRQCRCAGTSL